MERHCEKTRSEGYLFWAFADCRGQERPGLLAEKPGEAGEEKMEAGSWISHGNLVEQEAQIREVSALEMNCGL